MSEFRPGKNIAMKVPSHEFQRTVEFYRDIIGLQVIEDAVSADRFESVAFDFGGKNLWIDKISGISQAEIWLEIETDDVKKAEAYFQKQGCPRRDEIEPLPGGFAGFWICNPANIIHLINQ